MSHPRPTMAGLGYVRRDLEVELEGGTKIRLVADVDPAVPLDVEIRTVGHDHAGRPIGGPVLLERITRREIASGPTVLLDETLPDVGRLR